MKRVMLGFVFVLIFLSLLVSVSALERTRVYGIVNPNVNVNLKFSYYASSVHYDQISIAKANDLGKWEYVFRTDPGEIELTVISSGESKTFIVPVGPDFYADTGTSEDLLTSTSDNTTEEETNTTETATAEEEIEVAVTDEESSSALTGKAVSEGETFDFGNYSIYLILIGLFITIIIANLASHGILHLAKKSRDKEPREITITKLSDKLAERKKQDDEIEKKRYEEWKKQQEKQKKINDLKKQLQQLGEQ